MYDIPCFCIIIHTYYQLKQLIAMDAFIANKQNAKLLKVYLLKNSYQLVRSLDKETSSNLVSSCLIIRRDKLKNQTQFGYKQELKTGALKKIHFIYLPTLKDVIAFLWTHCKTKPLTAGIFIDSIEQYFGERFNFNENGRNITICMNLLHQLSNKQLISNRRVAMKIGFSFCYNQHIFPHIQFDKFMGSLGITIWQITPLEIRKNKEKYESQSTNKFIQTYGGALIKQQQ